MNNTEHTTITNEKRDHVRGIMDIQKIIAEVDKAIRRADRWLSCFRTGRRRTRNKVFKVRK